MEPALYAPEDLLGDDKWKQQVVSRLQPGADASEEQQPSSSWFSHWFGLSDARTSSHGAEAKSHASLNRPPFVSITCTAPQFY